MKRSNMWTGIAVGVVAAVVAPMLALAHHDSGEESGDDPIQVSASAGAGGSATAAYRIEGTRSVRNYEIDLNYEGSARREGRQVDENGTLHGSSCSSWCFTDEHVFAVEHCTALGGCVKTHWPLAGYWSDTPDAIGGAHFDGLLRPPSGGLCSLDVVFRNPGAPRVVRAGETLTTSHGGRVSERARIGRTAIAEMTLDCDATSGLQDRKLTSVDAAVYSDIAGSVRAIADATALPTPRP